MNEKRKNPRVESIYLLNYVHLDPEGAARTQGMGRTMNVSESGIMLETHVALPRDDTVDVVVGLKDDLVPIRGRVIFNRATASGRYQAGIEFLTIETKPLETLRRYISAFEALAGNES